MMRLTLDRSERALQKNPARGCSVRRGSSLSGMTHRRNPKVIAAITGRSRKRNNPHLGGVRCDTKVDGGERKKKGPVGSCRRRAHWALSRDPALLVRGSRGVAGLMREG